MSHDKNPHNYQPMTGLTMNPPTKLSRGRDEKAKSSDEQAPVKEAETEPKEAPPVEG